MMDNNIKVKIIISMLISIHRGSDCVRIAPRTQSKSIQEMKQIRTHKSNECGKLFQKV